MIGAVLAGGAGSRLGAGGEARGAAGRTAAGGLSRGGAARGLRAGRLVCKRDTKLPPLDGAERWDEPDEPRHPLTGIVHALERAGEPVLVCAADMPFVTADACRSLLGAPQKSVAVLAAADGVLTPTFGVYAPAALEVLRAAEPDAPLTRTVEALEPTRVALPPRVVQSVNTPEELAEAERLLASD